MDRLICGDVGYGKTEVAHPRRLQGGDGRQAGGGAGAHDGAGRAALPHLPRAHGGLPGARGVALALRTAQGADSASSPTCSAGAVDIVIGTHRILSQDVKFKNLGLVIIDEEQRFGVKQKESFKQLQANVDLLTMSATPIPRTLHMALSGLREMSLINTPPEGRMPVRTLAMEADDEVLREAILRELDRDGQVFVLHNRISSIYHVAEHIRSVVPQARVEVAHGQMAGRRA